MALETWLIKVRKSISNSLDTARIPVPNSKASKHKSTVGVLSFETAGLLSKLLHLWNSLSDKTMIRLRDESISLQGVRKIVSNDESFLLGLACAEMAENVRVVAKHVSRLSKRCHDSNLQCFDRWFDEFANSGHDSHGWVMSPKEMEAKNKKMDRYVTITATLYKEMEELSTIENKMRKCFQCKEAIKEQKIIGLQQRLFWQRQEVKYLKERSLWNRSFHMVVSMAVRSIFTILARIKLVFGIGPSLLPRSLSASATLHPTENPKPEEIKDSTLGFFESNSKLLKPPPSTLGTAALALHYSNLIIIMEK